MEQQKQFQKEKIGQLDALIERINSASDLLGRALKTSVQAAVTEEQTYDRVTAAASELRDGVAAAGAIRAQVREKVRIARDGAEGLLNPPETDKTESPVGGGLYVPPKASAMSLHL